METPENENPTETPDTPLAAARKAITQADAIAQKDRSAHAEAVKGFDHAIELLADSSLEESDERRHLLGWAEMGRANALVNSDTQQGVEGGIAGYQRALKHFEAIVEPSPSHQADIAAVWGNIGHTQSRVGQKEALAQAEQCFHQAVAILEKLPWQETPRFRHHLAATYLNLGNVFARQSDPTKPEKRTIAAFEKALETLGDLPKDQPAVGMLAASVHSSLGRALMWSAEKSNLDLAVASFEQTIRVIGEIGNKSDPRLGLEMASAHANRANLLSRAPASKETVEQTLSSSEFALKIAQPNEQKHLLAAEITLSARRSICHTFGVIVGGQSAQTQQEMHDKASDLIEEGLELVKLWESRGAQNLRPAAQHLFHLGCAFYCTQQPHFLPEFVNENLKLDDPDPIMLDSATKVIREAISRVEKADAADSEVAKALKQMLERLQSAA